jgi:hypothetical protein
MPNSPFKTAALGHYASPPDQRVTIWPPGRGPGLPTMRPLVRDQCSMLGVRTVDHASERPRNPLHC